MGKNQSASNLTNIIKQDASGNITFVSGSTTLMSVSSSGAVTTTGNVAGTASYATNAELFDGLDSTVFATTGSNTFKGSQYISSSFVPTNFTDTASLYTDGGLRVTKNAYLSSSLYVGGDLIIFGSQSVNYITSSQLNISDNIITVNTSTPAIRFGGLAVQDSGSLASGLTGSLLWDSQNNHWIYTNPSGSSYSGGMFISGPRASALGEEQGTTNNALMKGQGGDHITSSAVFEVSGSVGIGTSSPNEKLQVVGAISATGTATTSFGSSSTLDWYLTGTRIISRGANTTTRGTFTLKLESSDSSLNSDVLQFSNLGAATFSSTGSNLATFKTNNATDSYNSGIILAGNANATQANRSAYILLDPNGANGTGVDYGFFTALGTGETQIGTSKSDGFLALYTADTEKMRITSGGVVGFGITPASQNGGAYAGSAEMAGILRIQGGGGRYFTSGDGMEISKTSIYSYNRGTSVYNDLSINDSIVVKGGSGNVGIGFSTVSNKLQVAGEISTHAGTNTSYYAYMNYLGTTYNFGSGETGDNVDFKIAGGGTWTTGGNFRFYTQTGNTTPSERMRISANGKVTITGPAHNQLTVKDSDASIEIGADDNTMIGIGMVTAGDGITWFTGRHRPGSAGIYDEMNVARLGGSWVNLFRIYSNGNWDFAGSDVSDVRLKENIQTIDYNAVEKLIQLVPKSYNMIEHPTISKSGFIAQEVKEILPSFVTGNESENEYLGVDYNGILALTVKAIQELKAENDTLKEILQRNNIQ